MNWIVEVIFLFALMKYLEIQGDIVGIIFVVYIIWKIVGAIILSFITVTIKASAEVMKTEASKLLKLKKEMKKNEEGVNKECFHCGKEANKGEMIALYNGRKEFFCSDCCKVHSP